MSFSANNHFTPAAIAVSKYIFVFIHFFYVSSNSAAKNVEFLESPSFSKFQEGVSPFV